MEELYREGRIRAIGVSNFHPDRLMDLIVHNEVVPAVDQIETHPFNQQIETHKFLRANGIQHEAWAPFAEGQHNIFENEVLLSLAGKKPEDRCAAHPALADPTRDRGDSQVRTQGTHRGEFRRLRY